LYHNHDNDLGLLYFDEEACFTDRPTPVNSPATGDRQFKKQHQVQKAEDSAVDVAVDVLQKSW